MVLILILVEYAPGESRALNQEWRLRQVLILVFVEYAPGVKNAARVFERTPES